MKTCGQCIYYQKHRHIKDHGDCNVEVPPWVSEEMDDLDYTRHKDSPMADFCPYYREEQEDV